MDTHQHTAKHTPHAFAHVQCPCGQTVHVPVSDSDSPILGQGQYDIMSAKCAGCGRIATSGNSKTGQISSWMTPSQVNRANDEFAAQQFTCDDVNDW